MNHVIAILIPLLLFAATASASWKNLYRQPKEQPTDTSTLTEHHRWCQEHKDQCERRYRRHLAWCANFPEECRTRQASDAEFNMELHEARRNDLHQ